jgi:hypothetical protein
MRRAGAGRHPAGQDLTIIALDLDRSDPMVRHL